MERKGLSGDDVPFEKVREGLKALILQVDLDLLFEATFLRVHRFEGLFQDSQTLVNAALRSHGLNLLD